MIAGAFFVSWAIVQSQNVWKVLWGSFWLEMKIAFGNPTKRINFDFISGLFSKLIINLPAGAVPSPRLVGEGGMAQVKQEQSENHGDVWVGKNIWRVLVTLTSQISTPGLKTLCSVALPTTKALHLRQFLLREAFLFDKVLKHVLSSCLNLQDSA